MKNWLEGAYDLHVHCGPDLFDRTGDDIDFARANKAAGMAGMAVKAHLGCSAARGYYVNKEVPDFKYIPGICLNYPVGGINPSAVDASLKMGSRIVWMPNAHTKFHMQRKSLKAWNSNAKMYISLGKDGITIIDENGSLTQETKEVIDLVKQHNAVIGTSHLSPKEMIELAKYCKGEHVKVLLNHILWVPEYSIELGKEFADLGGIIELTACVVSGYTSKINLNTALTVIDEIGYKRMILASDAGGPKAPSPYEAMRMLTNNLALSGVEEEKLKYMLVHNPERLISK